MSWYIFIYDSSQLHTVLTATGQCIKLNTDLNNSLADMIRIGLDIQPNKSKQMHKQSQKHSCTKKW